MKKKPLQTLTIIHWSMAMPMLVFGFAAYSFSASAGEQEEMSLVLLGLPGVLLITAFPVSQILFNKAISGIRKEAELKSKLSGYLTAHILRMVMFEFAGLFAAVITFLSGDAWNLIVVAIALGIFFTNQPNPENVETALNLGPDERQNLRN